MEASTIERDAPTAVSVDAAVIDSEHLARVTFGDRRLERDVLQLFERQAVLLMARIRTTTPSAVGSLAHTLKGSASGIGAWPVARAAEAVEQASIRDAAACEIAVRQLGVVVDQARVTIIEMLRAS
jgi:HPt (histidine-containing phosphotransfer) domain-containing protein